MTRENDKKSTEHIPHIPTRLDNSGGCLAKIRIFSSTKFELNPIKCSRIAGETIFLKTFIKFSEFLSHIYLYNLKSRLLTKFVRFCGSTINT